VHRRKRYLLLRAGRAFTKESMAALKTSLQAFGDSRLIELKGAESYVVVKGTPQVTDAIREACGGGRLAGLELDSVLTSGNIGKLKRRAGAGVRHRHGEVSQ
jgi:hypothetical protein